MSHRAVVGVGVLGSTALAVGGYSVGAPPDAAHLPGALALCVAGVALLLAAWWLLREGDARTVLTAAGLWSLPLLVTPPLFSRDLYAYAGQAHLVLSGLDPYAVGPSAAPGPLAAEVDPIWAGTPSPYGPVFLRLAAGLVALTGQHPLLAAFALRLLAVAGIALLAWGLLRLAPAYGVPAGRAVWLGVANPVVLLHGVGGGHNDLLMVGLMVLGLSLVPRSLVTASVVITAGGLVKAPALLALAFLPALAGGAWLRRTLTTAVAAAVTAALLTLVCGLGAGWTGTLSGGEARRSLLSLTTGLAVLIGHEGALHQAGTALAGLLVLALLVTARRNALRHLGLAFGTAVLLAPVVQPWYLLWALPLLVVTVERRWAIGLAVGSTVLCLLILPSGRHLIRPPLYGVPLVLVSAASLIAGARGPRTPAGRIG